MAAKNIICHMLGQLRKLFEHINSTRRAHRHRHTYIQTISSIFSVDKSKRKGYQPASLAAALVVAHKGTH